MTSRRTLGPLHVTRDRGEAHRVLAAIYPADLSWVDDRALCAQTDAALFWVGPGQDGATKRAKEICQGCELREACLQYALEHLDFGGVWGATSPEDRKRLRKKRRAA